MLSPTDEAALIAAILQEATARNDGEALLASICERLVAAGLPLWRFNVAVPAIDPTVRGVGLTWVRGGSTSVTLTAHTEGERVFQRSPIFTLMESGETFGRWRLDEGGDLAAHPLLVDLRAAGATDYVLFLVPFVAGTALTGTGLSIASDAPGGFSEEAVAQVGRLVPAIGLAVFRLSLLRAATEALSTYLGPMTGRRVLAGEVRRGEGQTITAAILLADLSGFTTLADVHDPHDVVRWLDGHLEAVGEAVLAAGGEILKFIGDGLLAVFPLGTAGEPPGPCCARALAGARAAQAANEAVNARRRHAGEPTLGVDIVLHFGDVIYGNVGTTRRLDFTTIGRAVNEASRIETLCGELGRDILLSDPFAMACGGAFVPLGRFTLRGLATPRVLWGLP